MSEDKTNYLDDAMKLVDDRINLCQSNLDMFCKLVEYVGYDFVCTWPIDRKSYGISFGPYALCSTISRFLPTNHLICITFDSSFHVPYKWELRKFRKFFSMTDSTYIIATNALAIIKESLESGNDVFGYAVSAFHYADYVPSSKILFDHRKSIAEICIDADLHDDIYDE